MPLKIHCILECGCRHETLNPTFESLPIGMSSSKKQGHASTKSKASTGTSFKSLTKANAIIKTFKCKAVEIISPQKKKKNKHLPDDDSQPLDSQPHLEHLSQSSHHSNRYEDDTGCNMRVEYDGENNV